MSNVGWLGNPVENWMASTRMANLRIEKAFYPQCLDQNETGRIQLRKSLFGRDYVFQVIYSRVNKRTYG